MPSGALHTHWDSTTHPVLTIDSGDVVWYTLPDVTNGLIGPGSTASDLLALNEDYALAGPLGIHGAEVGDALEVEVLEMTPGCWGWTGSIPGFGLLREEFPNPFLHIWDLSGGQTTRFWDVAEIPLSPFCGTMGVSPVTSMPQAVMPPGSFGGNLDCRGLSQGVRLWLPIHTPGAGFSVGDPHAAQGHGEVAGTAIECPMEATLRFRLHKGMPMKGPAFRTTGQESRQHSGHASGEFVVLGIAGDLMEASRQALSRMLDWIVKEFAVSRLDAYILASVVVDLAIAEVVNDPRWVVSASIPLGIFFR